MHTRIGINGFGRTGRATFRAAYDQGADLEWVGDNEWGYSSRLVDLAQRVLVPVPQPA